MALMRTGVANLPLHTGNCPRWLFPGMVKLSKAISNVLIDEFGHQEFLRRLSNPYWFQALGCVIGFDWHSSGLTTTTLGALKEALNKENLGIYFAGGKGKTSRKTLEEINNTKFPLSDLKIEKLKYSSRMSAKVDSSLLQDGYNLYHHSFIFDEEGDWCVVQQGMSDEAGYARRYHWLSDNVASFVNEPHNAICCDTKANTLDMTSKENRNIQKTSLDIANDNPANIKKYFNRIIKNHFTQRTLAEFSGIEKELSMPSRHYIIDMDKRNIETLKKAYEIQPRNYEELAAIKGVGPKTIRSLALVSELVYGEEISWKDPVKYSFAHGGKDNIPYPTDMELMDNNAELLGNAIKEAKLGDKDKINAIRRLHNFYQ